MPPIYYRIGGLLCSFFVLQWGIAVKFLGDFWTFMHAIPPLSELFMVQIFDAFEGTQDESLMDCMHATVSTHKGVSHAVFICFNGGKQGKIF